MAVVVYLYTVIAFNFFRKFYTKEEDEEREENCKDMLTVRKKANNTDYLFEILISVLNFICIRVFELVEELVMNLNHRMEILWNYIELFLILHSSFLLLLFFWRLFKVKFDGEIWFF